MENNNLVALEKVKRYRKNNLEILLQATSQYYLEKGLDVNQISQEDKLLRMNPRMLLNPVGLKKRQSNNNPESGKMGISFVAKSRLLKPGRPRKVKILESLEVVATETKKFPEKVQPDVGEALKIRRPERAQNLDLVVTGGNADSLTGKNLSKGSLLKPGKRENTTFPECVTAENKCIADSKHKDVSTSVKMEVDVLLHLAKSSGQLAQEASPYKPKKVRPPGNQKGAAGFKYSKNISTSPSQSKRTYLKTKKSLGSHPEALNSKDHGDLPQEEIPVPENNHKINGVKVIEDVLEHLVKDNASPSFLKSGRSQKEQLSGNNSNNQETARNKEGGSKVHNPIKEIFKGVGRPKTVQVSRKNNGALEKDLVMETVCSEVPNPLKNIVRRPGRPKKVRRNFSRALNNKSLPESDPSQIVEIQDGGKLLRRQPRKKRIYFATNSKFLRPRKVDNVNLVKATAGHLDKKKETTFSKDLLGNPAEMDVNPEIKNELLQPMDLGMKPQLEENQCASKGMAINPPFRKKTRKRKIFFATKSKFLRPREPTNPEGNEPMPDPTVSGTQPEEKQEETVASKRTGTTIYPFEKKTRKKRIHFATKSKFLRPRKQINPGVNEATNLDTHLEENKEPENLTEMRHNPENNQTFQPTDSGTKHQLEAKLHVPKSMAKNLFGKKTRKRKVYFATKSKFLRPRKPENPEVKKETAGPINPDTHQEENKETAVKDLLENSTEMASNPEIIKQTHQAMDPDNKPQLEKNLCVSKSMEVKSFGKKTRKKRIHFATKSKFLRSMKPKNLEVNGLLPGPPDSGAKPQLKEQQLEIKAPTEMSTKPKKMKRRFYFPTNSKFLRPRKPNNLEITKETPESRISDTKYQREENTMEPAGSALLAINPFGNGGIIKRRPGRPKKAVVFEATKPQLMDTQTETVAPKDLELAINPFGKKNRKKMMYLATHQDMDSDNKPQLEKNVCVSKSMEVTIIGKKTRKKNIHFATKSKFLRSRKPKNPEVIEVIPGTPDSGAKVQLKEQQQETKAPTEMSTNPKKRKRRFYFSTNSKFLRPRKPNNLEITKEIPKSRISGTKSQREANKMEPAGSALLAINPFGNIIKRRPGRPKNAVVIAATKLQLMDNQAETVVPKDVELAINPYGKKNRKKRMYSAAESKFLRPRKPGINKVAPESLILGLKSQQKENKVEFCDTTRMSVNPFGRSRNGELQIIKRRPGKPKNSKVNEAPQLTDSSAQPGLNENQGKIIAPKDLKQAINPFGNKTRKKSIYLATNSKFLRPRKPAINKDTPESTISGTKSKHENKVKLVGATQMAINPFGRTPDGQFRIIKRPGRPKKIQNSGTSLKNPEKTKRQRKSGLEMVLQDTSESLAVSKNHKSSLTKIKSGASRNISSDVVQEISTENPILESQSQDISSKAEVSAYEPENYKFPELSICLMREEFPKEEKKVFYLNPAKRRGRPPKYLQYLGKKKSLVEPIKDEALAKSKPEKPKSDSHPEQTMVEVMGPDGPVMAEVYKPDFETYLPAEIIDIGERWKRKRKRKRRSYERKEWKGESTSEQEKDAEGESRKRRKLRRRRSSILEVIKSDPEVFEIQEMEPPEIKEESEDYYQTIEDEDTIELVCPELMPSKSRIEILSDIQIVSGSPVLDVSWTNLFPDMDQQMTPDELLEEVNEIQHSYDPDVFKNVKIEVVSLGQTDEENEMNDGAEGDDEWEDDDTPMTSQPQPMPPPNQIPQQPNSMQGGYRPQMPPSGRPPAPRGPQPGASRMPGGPRGPNLINQRAPGMRPRAPMIRPRGAGPQQMRGGQMRPRMGGPPPQRGGVTSPLKRHPGPVNMNNANVKRKRVDVLTPSDKDDDDCQVICMQPKNTGLPQIESVQGAESVENSIMKLSDSITLTSVRPQPKSAPVSPQKSETAKAVANVLASRGITVTSSGKTKEAPSAKQAGLPPGINLNGSISIVAKAPGSDGLPTVDLTDEVNNASPNSPNKTRAGLPYRCDLCPATYPNAMGLNKHRQTYHKTNSGMSELGVPLVNLKTPGIMQKLSQVGINNYIPLQAATPEGTFAIPLINTKSPGNVAALGATQMLTLGPVRPIPRPNLNNVNSPTKKL